MFATYMMKLGPVQGFDLNHHMMYGIIRVLWARMIDTIDNTIIEVLIRIIKMHTILTK